MLRPPHVLLRGLFAALVAMALAGCASTQFVSQWGNAQFAGTRFARILVVGVVNDASLRRQFEDDFVRQAAARGITAVQSYRYLPNDGQQSEADLDRAVKESNADGLLISVVRAVNRETTVSPGVGPPPPPFGFGYWGFYNWGWGGAYMPPRIVQFDVIFVETQLHSVKPGALVWSGTTRTTDPSTAAKEIPPFVTLILGALAQGGFVP
jgi:hypothetical protein